MASGGWRTSTRLQRLPPEWKNIRKRVLKRDKWCRLCEMNLSREVDHIRPGDNHSEDNLRGVCGQCHAAKSAQEGASASARVRRAQIAARKRPPEPHPGGW